MVMLSHLDLTASTGLYKLETQKTSVYTDIRQRKAQNPHSSNPHTLEIVGSFW